MRVVDVGGRNGCGTSSQRQPKMVQCETHCTLHLLAGAGAIGGFGEGEAVGIVLHPDFPAQEGGNVLVELVAVEGDGVGVLDHEGAGGDDAGDAEADGGAAQAMALGHLLLDPQHHIGHAAHGCLVARGGGDTVAVEKAAIGGEGGDLGFSAAEVDADADVVGRDQGRMVRRCRVWLKAGGSGGGTTRYAWQIQYIERWACLIKCFSFKYNSI
jgi:hypothetical protein